MFRKHILAGVVVCASAVAAAAAPILPGSDGFGQLTPINPATDITFGGTGIPTTPFAFSEFDLGNGTTLKLGLGVTQRFFNAEPQSFAPNEYQVRPGANFGTPGGTGPSSSLGSTWNFNLYAETDTGANLNDLGIKLLFDFDPGADTDETDFGVLDFNGAATFFAALASVSPVPPAPVYQESENALFSFLNPGSPLPFVTPPATAFDPFALGQYDIALAFDDGTTSGRVSVRVSAVPVPPALAGLGLALAALGVYWRRQRRLA